MPAAKPKLTPDMRGSFASAPSEPLKLRVLTWVESLTFAAYKAAAAAEERERRQLRDGRARAEPHTASAPSALLRPPLHRWPLIALTSALGLALYLAVCVVGLILIILEILTDRAGRWLDALWRNPD